MAEAASAGGAADRVRDAATVILWREGAAGPEVLMGTRGGRAAFMPNKVVFPGGAVDAGDAAVPLAGAPETICRTRLTAAPREGAGLSAKALATALLAAAIREVWEETGLVIGRPGRWADPAPDWVSFAATGHRPDAAQFRYVFRAVTPPGRPRRFDARFFLVSAAEAVAGGAEDFSRASGELSHLQWVPLSRARSFDLPFITEVVLAEIGPLIAAGGPVPASVPYVRNDDPVSSVTRIV